MTDNTRTRDAYASKNGTKHKQAANQGEAREEDKTVIGTTKHEITMRGKENTNIDLQRPQRKASEGNGYIRP